jgi:hypothetical protein
MTSLVVVIEILVVTRPEEGPEEGPEDGPQDGPDDGGNSAVSIVSTVIAKFLKGPKGLIKLPV